MPSKKRNYRREYDNYQGKPAQKKKRAKRNAARRTAERDGRVRKGDGKDIDHRVPLSQGGGNGKANTRVKSKSANRSFARTSSGAVKGKARKSQRKR